MNKVDVIIIGAGPAGACCAKKIAEAGFSVSVYDRRKELGQPKRCGEGVEKTVESLIGEIPKKCVARRIIGARVYAPNGKFLESKLYDGGYVLERKVFDKWLASEAVKAGANIQCDAFIEDVIKENNFISGVNGKISGENFEQKARIVVCATGTESPLPSKAGISNACKLNLIDTCLQYEMAGVELEQEDWQDFIHIFLGNDIAKRGYAWIFPKGNETANVGIGVMPSEKTPEYYLKRFLEKIPSLNKGSIIEVNAGGVPVGGLLENMAGNGFLLCGEAAHHVNPVHGGGIKEAIISGQLAAEVIINCLKKNDVSKEALSEFNKLWWEKRGEHLKKIEKVRDVIEKLSDNDFNDLVEALTPDDMIQLSRGAKLSVLAKALMRKPSLAGLARHLL